MEFNNIGEEILIYAGLVTFVFVCLKVAGRISWSWIWVFSPLWLYVVAFISALVIAIVAYKIKTRLKKKRGNKNE